MGNNPLPWVNKTSKRTIEFGRKSTAILCHSILTFPFFLHTAPTNGLRHHVIAIEKPGNFRYPQKKTTNLTTL